MPAVLRISAVLAVLAFASVAEATDVAPATLVVPAGPGQQTLALEVEGGGVRARVCASAPCSGDGAALLPAAEGPKPRFERAKATSVVLDGGRAIARVDAPGDVEGATWVLLVAAPLAGEGTEPVVLWSGWTGTLRGEEGEEHGAAVVVERTPKGGARVLVGDRRADVGICGRPALVGVRAVDPQTLTLVRGASLQNLSVEERAKATKIGAVRASDAAPRTPAQVLRATAASSAYEKKLAAITDGDLATAWSENKHGDGRGEFVTMSAPEEVGIGAIDVVVRPTENVPDGAAPRRFYLATPDALYDVAMPEDAWQKPPGTRYTVKLPREIHTSCVAVVLDEAYAGGRADARVTLAEVTARTAFDGATPEALAGALAGGSARSKAAAALLVRSGPAGMAAAIGVYDKLDDAGKELARSVVDAAPCSEQVPFFARRFGAAAESRGKAAPGDVDPELAHARDRLRRCGRAAASALVDLVAKGPPRTKVMAADELAVLAPSEAVPALLDAIGAADDATRSDLRAALARAAQSPRAEQALRAELAKDRLGARSEVVAIDLLRAIGPRLGPVGASGAFADVSARATSFRGRFLLQGPAAELASGGDVGASAYLVRSLREDADAHVRARAAEVAGHVPALGNRLVEALEDADPRVREAAVAAFAEDVARPAALAGASAIRKRLAVDDWTFVRSGAARALGVMPADAATDRALADALGDGSADVRGPVLDALGAHRAAAYADAVRARQDDDGEVIEVRARAILALGAMCDARSVDAWTKLARAAKRPADDRDRRLGGAAIGALGELHPADLASRLGPLLEADAPLGVREMAKAALAAPGTCGSRGR